jgi:pilus assembly protein CpaE
VVKNLMRDQGIANAYVTRGAIDDAIELMRTMDHSPRHLLVDVSGSSMPISDLMRLAEVVDPSVNVVVVGDHNDVGLFRSLLRMGVQDYLVKPLTVELVQRALAASDPAASARAGKAIGLIGARGGVGVTTIATALARHLADKTRRRIDARHRREQWSRRALAKHASARSAADSSNSRGAKRSTVRVQRGAAVRSAPRTASGYRRGTHRGA